MASQTVLNQMITGLILGIDADRTVTLPSRLWLRVARSFDAATYGLIADLCFDRPAEEQVSIQCDAASGAMIADALRDYRAGIRR